MLFAFRAFPEFCKISRALPRVRVSVARYIRWSRAFPRRSLGKSATLFCVVPSSLRSLNLNNFHFATVSQVGRKFTGVRGEGREERRSSTSDGTDNRHRVGMFLPRICVRYRRRFHESKMKGKKRPRQAESKRAGKKLRSQTVTETFSAPAVHDSPLYVTLTKSAAYPETPRTRQWISSFIHAKWPVGYIIFCDFIKYLIRNTKLNLYTYDTHVNTKHLVRIPSYSWHLGRMWGIRENVLNKFRINAI